MVELVSALCRVYDNWLQYKAVKFPEDVHWDVVPVRSLAKIVMVCPLDQPDSENGACITQRPKVSVESRQKSATTYRPFIF